MYNHSKVIGNELFVTSAHKIEITTDKEILKEMEYVFSDTTECGKLFLIYNSKEDQQYKQLAFMGYDLKKGTV